MSRIIDLADLKEGSRFAVVDPEKCNPSKCNKECLKACPINRQSKGCITLGDVEDAVPTTKKKKQKASIAELLCIGCGICIKVCPFKAIQIFNIPKLVADTVVHRYLPNGFQLSGIPLPRRGKILGLVGRNGTGKTTAMQIISGRTSPNLGREHVTYDDLLDFFRGTDHQLFMATLRELVVKVKPQFVDQLHRVMKGKVGEILMKINDREKFDEAIDSLDLRHLLDRDVDVLSGGELQRLAIAAVYLRHADMYIFDEASSYLDIKQRLQMADLIGKLAEGSDKYVIAIEHDLAVLDYLSDNVQILYGKPSAYGIVSTPFSNAHGVNVFLDGYDPVSNIRFRRDPLKFRMQGELFEEAARSSNSYPSFEKRLEGFHITGEGGEFDNSQVTVLLGQNGCGKTTFVRILAGLMKDDSGAEMPTIPVSYKPQKINPTFEGTVRELLFEKCRETMTDAFFRTAVLDVLEIERLMDLGVKHLSGGELQRVAIALALGKPALLYLLDEPSAYLDAEMRIEVARMIRRFAYTRNVSIFLIDHDMLMCTYCADRILLFTGEPGVRAHVHAPMAVKTGIQEFLRTIDMTIRCDKKSGRPRYNKRDSVLDREQRASGNLFQVD